MAIAFVTETFYTEVALSSTSTVTPANTSGNLLVLCAVGRAAGGAPAINTVADTGGDTWTKVDSLVGGTLDGELWYSLTTHVAGTVTVTWDKLTSSVVSCQEISGIAAAPLDQAATPGTGSSTTALSGSTGITAQQVEIAVGFVACGGALPTFSGQTAGYTANTEHQSAIAGVNSSLQSAYRILAATGVQAYGCTISASVTWVAFVATFKGSVIETFVPQRKTKTYLAM